MQDLPRIIKKLLMSEGFYGLMLVGMKRNWTKTRIPTACVMKPPESINIELMINEDFWDILKEDIKKVMVLKHELLHIALGHLFMQDKMPDKDLMNIAADIEVNQYIPGIEKWTEPIQACCIEQFPELKLKPKGGALYYYDELSKAKNKKQKSKGKGEDSKAGEPGNGNGTSGSKALDQYLDNQEMMEKIAHDLWKQIKEATEAEQKLIQKQLDTQMKNVAEQVEKSRGNIPHELEEILKRLFEVKPPVVDWKSLFRKFVGKSITPETKRTRKKENHRFPDSPGMKHKRKIHIVYALDESGSMGEKEMEETNNELYHQWKAGAEITVLHWDTDVHAVTKYDGRLEIIRHCAGGTYASSAIQWINDNRKKFTVAFVATDGYIEHEPIQCNVPMMWIITSSGSEEFTHHAKKVKIQFSN